MVQQKLSIFLFSALLMFSQAVSAEGNIRILKHVGKVLINGKALNKSTILKAGDEIVAKGKKTFVIFKSENFGTVMIKDAVLIINKTKKEATTMDLAKGMFFHYLDSSKKKHDFKLKTRTAVMGVRGTKYFVNESRLESYLCVCEGKVAATSTNFNKEYLVGVGEDLHLNDKEANAKVVKANKQMIDMAGDAFEVMGHPLK